MDKKLEQTHTRTKTILVLTISQNYTVDQNQDQLDMPQEIEWPLDIPRVGDYFDAKDIVFLPEYNDCQHWEVVSVTFKKLHGIIKPVIVIEGA